MLWKVKLGFTRLSVPEKIQKARYIVSCMSKTASYENAEPSLGSIQILVNELETASIASADGGAALTARTRELEKQLTEQMTLLASYVQTASKGVQEMILASGMDVANVTKVPVEMTQPLSMHSTTTKISGQIILDWASVKGARTYMVEMSPDGTTNWQPAGVTTKAKITIDNLTPVSVVWFRACAVGTVGKGPWSDPVKALVG